MHKLEIPGTLKAVGRAGAGVNNIPVAKMSERGIPVFNAPGANANAVKELVVAGLILACRQICEAWDFARQLSRHRRRAAQGSSRPARRTSRASSCPGARSRSSALARSAGSSPTRASRSAWTSSASIPASRWKAPGSCPSAVKKARSLDEALAAADFVTVHVPLIEATQEARQRRTPEDDEEGRGHPQLRARGHRGRRGGGGGDRCGPRARLRQRLPDQPDEESQGLHHAAAPGRLDGGSRRQLRDHGRRSGEGLPARTATSATP